MLWPYLITYRVVIAVGDVVAIAVVVGAVGGGAVVASMCVLIKMREFAGECGRVGHYDSSSYIVPYTLFL